MNQRRIRSTVAVFLFAISANGARTQPSPQTSPRSADLISTDGTVLKVTFFRASSPGPGVLLYHQSNRSRASWGGVARQLAAAGINALSVDERGYGESSGKKDDRERFHQADLSAAFEFLASQPGVQRDRIGAAGAGWLGVDNSVETARLHSTQLKSLVLISGETLLPQLKFLHQASNLPALFIVSDDDEYPPTVEAMEWLYDASSSPEKQFIHYFGPRGPWIWYETSNASRVPATGSHGTDLFQRHSELPATIVDWFVTTLIGTPGHAPVDAVASAAILHLIDSPDGLASAKQQLLDARRKDPKANLWPEVNVDIFGEDHMRQAAALEKDGHATEAAAEKKLGVETFQLNLLAYPDSADAHYNLADAYLQTGEKKLALEYAQRALAMIDSHAAPLSSWSDTEQRRAEIRGSVEDTLKKLGAPAQAPPAQPASSNRVPRNEFRDCVECPEMLVIPAGKFIMGSSAEEKSWAAARAGSADGVADEAPQHEVSVPSFALGKYDVTRAEYSAFVRETAYSVTDGCGIDGFDWKKLPEKTWQNPGYKQTDRDPVVCVSWQDAKAYIAWLNGKVRHASATSGEGPYRLPSESEWEYATRAGSTTKFFWGDDEGAASDHAWFKSNANNQTHPVGQKLPNQFGLYDMVGNVWQWTEDCYDSSYSPAPPDGRANENPSTRADARAPRGDCLRVDRGAWFAFPTWALRSATRERNPADYRDTVMGFRVARTLP